MHALWIALGGALGSLGRHAVGELCRARLGTGYPWGTLTVNVTGSLLLAILACLATRTTAVHPTVRIALATGVLGGFTTYSTFNLETLMLVQDGEWSRAAGYLALTTVSCLLAAVAGWFGTRALLGI